MHSDFQRMFAVFGVFAVLLVLIAAITKINLKEQATPPGSNGQLLFNNNGVVDAEDPVVSQATASNLNAQVVGNTASGSADSGNPVKTGCVFNTTQPTVTTGQRVDCQASNRGEIFVAPGASGFSIANTGFNVNNFPAGFNVNNSPTVNQGGAPWSQNITQWAGVALGAMANYGTSPGAVAVPGVNAFITNTPSVSISGTPTVTANAGTGNFSVNLAQFNGSAVGSTNPQFMRECDGTNCVTLDPCRVNANSFAKINQTANTQVITGTANKKTYICAINLVTAGANNVAIVEGTGTVCATGIAGVSTGGTTAATGWNFAANDGLTQGNGMGSIMAANNANADNVCILQSAAVQLSGVISYVQQ